FRRTQGQPLFVASLLDYFVNQHVLFKVDGAWRIGSETAIAQNVVPGDLMNMITHQMDRLTDDDVQLLEIATLPAVPFSPVAISRALRGPGVCGRRTGNGRAARGLAEQGSDPGGGGASRVAGRNIFGILFPPPYPLSKRTLPGACTRTTRSDPPPHGRALGRWLWQQNCGYRVDARPAF